MFAPRDWSRIAASQARFFGSVLCLVTFLLLLLPWSLYKLNREGTMNWSTAGLGYNYSRMWQPDEEQAPWAIAANSQCRADPLLCRVVQANREEIAGDYLLPFGVLTTLRFPRKVMRDKIMNFSHLWWGLSFEELAHQPAVLLEGIVLLALGLAGTVLLAHGALCRRSAACALALIVVATFVVYNATLFTFLHFEWRFSLPARSLAYLAPFWAVRMVRPESPG